MSKTTLYTKDICAATGYREATLEELLTAAKHALALRVRRGALFTSPRLTADYLMTRMATLPHELFTLIYVDKRHRFIAAQDLFRGTLDGASVHPREVVIEALKHQAASVILAHNHPSGVAEPSQADEFITHRLRDALSLVDIRVLDHIIVANNSTVSFAERGIL